MATPPLHSLTVFLILLISIWLDRFCSVFTDSFQLISIQGLIERKVIPTPELVARGVIPTPE